MKLAPLLARFLYTNNRMELPGIGCFILNPQPYSTEKNNTPESVTFQNDPAIRHAPELIQFISSETGKMKALAAADLDSFLELAQQFLNIGKPFLFDGIGSLVKLRNGEYSFTEGPLLPEAFPQKESPGSENPDGHGDDYKNIFYSPRVKSSSKKVVSLILAITGIAFALWGGFTVYKRNANNSNSQEATTPVFEEPVEYNTVTANDSMYQRDSLVIPAVATSTQAKRKFVLETASEKRAFARYNKLKSFQWKVEMETNDSVLYKLYVMMPASAIDTTRILDSLTRMNGRRVHME